jgi:hypothetical protein
MRPTDSPDGRLSIPVATLGQLRGPNAPSREELLRLVDLAGAAEAGSSASLVFLRAQLEIAAEAAEHGSLEKLYYERVAATVAGYRRVQGT